MLVGHGFVQRAHFGSDEVVARRCSVTGLSCTVWLEFNTRSSYLLA